MHLPQDANIFCCSELRYPILPQNPLLPHVPTWLLSCYICTRIKNSDCRNYYLLEWNRSTGLKYPPFAEHTGSLPWRLLWQKGEMEAAGFFRNVGTIIPDHTASRRKRKHCSCLRPSDPHLRVRPDPILKEINSINTAMTPGFVRLPFKQDCQHYWFLLLAVNIVHSGSHSHHINL
jgi:hypothetical protein